MSTTHDGEAARMRGFTSLARDEQAQVVRRMADLGMGDYAIAAATLLSVEMVRAILSERAASQ